MASQEVSLTVTLRDEVSAELKRIADQIEATRSSAREAGREGESGFRRIREEVTRSGSSVRTTTVAMNLLGREVSSVTQLLGVGTLGSAGLVAATAAVAKSLADFSKEALNTRYTAQAMQMSSQELRSFQQAAERLGISQAQATQQFGAVANSVVDMWRRGSAAHQDLVRIGREDIINNVNQIRETQGVAAAIEYLAKVYAQSAPWMQRYMEQHQLAAVWFRDLLKAKSENVAQLPQDEAAVFKLRGAWADVSTVVGNAATAFNNELGRALGDLREQWKQSGEIEAFDNALTKLNIQRRGRAVCQG